MNFFSVLLPEYEGATVVVVEVVADDTVTTGRITLRVVVGIVTTGRTGKGAKVGAIVAKVCAAKKGLWVVVVLGVANGGVWVVNGGMVKALKLGVVWNKKGVNGVDLMVK